MSQQQFEVFCKLCQNKEVIDYEPTQEKPWICICKLKDQPGQFTVCSNHNYRYWGQTGDCKKCLEEKAGQYADNLNAVHVGYGLINWPDNIKKTNYLERDGDIRQQQLDREQKRIEQEQAWKKAQKDSVYALVELPNILRKIDAKLNKLLKIQGEGFIVN